MNLIKTEEEREESDSRVSSGLREKAKEDLTGEVLALSQTSIGRPLWALKATDGEQER